MEAMEGMRDKLLLAVEEDMEQMAGHIAAEAAAGVAREKTA